MKGKTLKKLNLLLIAIFTLFLGINVYAEDSRPQSNSTFIYDYTFQLRLGEAVKSSDGKYYTVPVTGYLNTLYLEEEKLDLTQSDEIHFKVTDLNAEVEAGKITQEDIDKMLAAQDAIDALDKTVINSDADIYMGNGNIELLQQYIRDNIWWCYNQYEYDKDITLTVDCETKYYMVTVDAMDMETTESNGYIWNKHAARIYKIEADPTLCPTTPEPEEPEEPTPDPEEPTPDPEEPEEPTPDPEEPENPKTGLTTPYIICGVLALGSIIIIIVSKKEKFM